MEEFINLLSIEAAHIEDPPVWIFLERTSHHGAAIAVAFSARLMPFVVQEHDFHQVEFGLIMAYFLIAEDFMNKGLKGYILGAEFEEKMVLLLPPLLFILAGSLLNNLR